jgi:hypothetical protein
MIEFYTLIKYDLLDRWHAKGKNRSMYPRAHQHFMKLLPVPLPNSTFVDSK